MIDGFIKVATAIPAVKVADCVYNVARIESLIQDAFRQNCDIVVFPETSITSYTCGDLFLQSFLLDQAKEGLGRILNRTQDLDLISIVGMPLVVDGGIANVAVVVQKGRILGVVPKTFLPNYKEFYEKRWFVSGRHILSDRVVLCGQEVPFGTNLLFDCGKTKFGIEICEDLWAPIPPSSRLALAGAELIFNLSADNEMIGKHDYLLSLIAQQSSRCICGYVFSSCGFGESTTDVVFAGNALVYENGRQLAASKRFCFEEQLIVADVDVELLRMERRQNTTFASCQSLEDLSGIRCVHCDVPQRDKQEVCLTRTFERLPFVPSGKMLDDRCEEIFSIQMSGLAQRIRHTHARTAVVGISGGLDSTLALLVCVKTFDKMGLDRKNIIGVTMPGFGTTDRTYNNALNLMRQLGIGMREISIVQACKQHYEDIGHDIEVHDVTYENSQARERTQILMDVANQTAGIVIGTGDLSELALGWATYNGDHMSMYGVNSSIPKTLVKHLVIWVAQHEMDEETCATLLDIVDTPISPELIPADSQGNISQKTEDLVGPYELHDFFLYHFVRLGEQPAKIYNLACRTFGADYTADVIKKWLYIFFRRFFNQQFKRSCLPDGPKVGSVSLSPRGDWRMPSDACVDVWLKEIESL